MDRPFITEEVSYTNKKKIGNIRDIWKDNSQKRNYGWLKKEKELMVLKI